jgi:transposase
VRLDELQRRFTTIIIVWEMSLKAKFVTEESVTKKIYQYFSREARRDKLYCSLSNPEKRTMHILGLSKRSFLRWTQGCEINCSVNACSKGRREKLDSFDKEIVRREIRKMFDLNEEVTLRKLRVWLKQNNDIEISKTTLWKNVRAAGFTFRKYAGGRSTICEKPHIVAMRSRYLREVKQMRSECYDIVYLDETWVNAHHTNEKEWQSSDGIIKRSVPSSKGQRLIIAHAGSRQYGLLKNAGMTFVSRSTDNRDYHTEMNGHKFREWMEQTVLPLLDRPSCLIMDNASYHNVISQEDKIPTSSSTKDAIKSWLTKEHIPFNNMCLKPELLSLVKQTRRTKIFEIDKLIQYHGHRCLRLPPYHSHLNPIELVWAKVKKQVAAENNTFKLCDVKNITHAAFSMIDKEYWSKCEDHVLTQEEEYWKNDGLWNVQPKIVINLHDSSDSE